MAQPEKIDLLGACLRAMATPKKRCRSGLIGKYRHHDGTLVELHWELIESGTMPNAMLPSEIKLLIKADFDVADVIDFVFAWDHLGAPEVGLNPVVRDKRESLASSDASCLDLDRTDGL